MILGLNLFHGVPGLSFVRQSNAVGLLQAWLVSTNIICRAQSALALSKIFFQGISQAWIDKRCKAVFRGQRAAALRQV